ncbi:MAG: oligosaccharide flippase family protein [Gemmatimonadota bacterium]|nr:oligosaccharide flippase family protein [Gemmatimonadota bacterium]
MFRILTSLDASVPQGRSRERYRRIGMSAAMSGLALVTSTVVSLILVPISLQYLGAERYGLWLVVASLGSLLAVADFGIGNGMVNAIARADGRDDREGARQSASTAFLLVTCLALGVGGCFAVLYSLVPWSHVFNVHSTTAVSESGPTALVLVAVTLVGMPIAIVQRIRFGYQEGFTNGLWLVGGSLASLIAVVSVIQLHASLPWIVLAMTIGPVVATALNGVFLFRARRWLSPKRSSVTRSAARRILSAGALFFLLQIAITIAYNSDNFFVAQFFGAQAVAEYSVTLRLFAIAPLLLGVVLQPLWPAYGEAITRGDIAWARRTLRRSLLLGLVVVVPLTLVILVLAVPIIHFWVGPDLTPSTALLLGCAVWALLSVPGGAFAMFLNGANRLRFQVLTALAMMSAAIAGKLLLPDLLGSSGVIWADVLAQSIFVTLPTTAYVLWSLPRMESHRQPGNVP